MKWLDLLSQIQPPLKQLPHSTAQIFLGQTTFVQMFLNVHRVGAFSSQNVLVSALLLVLVL